ncbi:carbohydrate kinase family protein [Desulforamulus hydrothermalis]|uniref:carbohydrate kinase family protein n=1 Tax=Desulforamulus hydrothermalis TaxID=412895 RepID=UPI000918844D|nr:sugar kinase [Desulforamulus hydrothermalis]SHG72579.1 Sugar or nucleoside kinase, ribokinase family [Desulforamulus hydrothermalis Lam5 = DSM 18033]
MPDVLCLGIIVADLVAKPVTGLPPRGGLKLVDSIQLHNGGCAVNTATALAKLGFTAAVSGMVGNDGLGQVLIDNLVKAGVDTRYILKTDQAGTSVSMVLVDSSGERSFIHYTGANALLQAADFNATSLADTRILHIAGSLLMPGFDGEPCAAVLKTAKSRGLMTTLDTAWDDTGRWMKAIGPCLPYVDIFIPSLAEARMLTGLEDLSEIARVFLDHGVKTVVIKLGADGCYIQTRDASYHIPGFKVRAVDATGAGDCFVAGFLAGVLQGLPANRCGLLANAVGAMSVTSVGAATGVKSLTETFAFMNSSIEIQEGQQWQR